MAEREILEAIKVLDPESPQWGAMHAIIEGQVETELSYLLTPNLTNDAAQYNRGRLAAMKDFQGTLFQLMERAREVE
jgi:transcriptional regulatory protein LevR